MKPTFTIGISFKNPGDYFPIALQSIFAQTFTDWELLLIDDGSTDDSPALALRLQDPRVRVVCEGKSLGLSARLNQMVQLSSAAYFVRMDADDIMHPDRLELQLKMLHACDQNTVIGSAAYTINSGNQVLGIQRRRTQQGFGIRHSFVHPTVAAPVEWFRRNPYSEDAIFTRCEDAELWCRTALRSRFVNMAEPLLFYRQPRGLDHKKYLASNCGLLQVLFAHFSDRRLMFLWLFSRELAKIGFIGASFAFGRSDWLARRNSQPLPEREQHDAQQIIAKVMQQPLPLV